MNNKKKRYYVYMITNKHNTVLYTGITGDLPKRVYEHKEKLVNGFTKKYNVDKIVYFESFENVDNEIQREKQIKNYSRKRKEELINEFNEEWKDLYTELPLF